MSSLRGQKISLFALWLVVLTACLPIESIPTPTGGPTAVLLPYQTAIPTAAPTLDAGDELDLPTPTPATYIVAEGDTFFTIAARLGISLDALMAANPDADPQLLTPGTTLLLPVAGGTAVASIPTPTPVPLAVGETRCYASAAGELWCFLPVENTLAVSVENLTAVVQLLTANGELVTTMEATAPLNLLGAGGAMPLVAYSSSLPEEWRAARGQLLSAFSLAEESNYYLAATIQGSSFDISEDGLAARVVGRVEIQEGEAATVWVLAVAYDAEGRMVGFRRWESEGETEFDFIVYSLGPDIVNVDLLVEVRP